MAAAGDKASTCCCQVHRLRSVLDLAVTLVHMLSGLIAGLEPASA